jgi:hypothetical protein
MIVQMLWTPRNFCGRPANRPDFRIRENPWQNIPQKTNAARASHPSRIVRGFLFLPSRR